jgi:hypothetical protein
VNKLSIEQVAYAFEQRGLFRSEQWIANRLGVSLSCLRRHLRGAERYGFSFWTQNPSYCLALLSLCLSYS